MGELKRFDFEMNGDDPQTVEAPDGDWVRYEDADTLLSQVAIARAEVERLRTDLMNTLDDLNRNIDQLEEERAEACVADTSLATANALLVRFAKYWKEDRASSGKSTRLPRLRDEVVTHLAAQPATAQAPAPRYALNFCSMCGGRLDCEECKEADARPPVDPNDLVGVTAMHTASQYKPPLPPLALVEDRTAEQLAADGDEP